MMFKIVTSCFLIFSTVLASADFAFSVESLEDVKIENKSLEMEIASLKRKISDLENNPPEHPDCAGMRVKMNAVENSKSDVGEKKRVAQASAADIDKKIADLKAKEADLDKSIKTQKNAQLGTGITAGVTGAAAIGLGIWSHIEKNNIEKGKYTNDGCVSKVFEEFGSKEKISALKRKNTADALLKLSNLHWDCKKCCPGKEDACNVEAERIGDIINGKSSSNSSNEKYLCWDSMQKNNLYEAVLYSRDKMSEDNYETCYSYIRDNYGAVAVRKTQYLWDNGSIDNAMRSCKDYCSFDNRNLPSDYSDNCVRKCSEMRFKIGRKSLEPLETVKKSTIDILEAEAKKCGKNLSSYMDYDDLDKESSSDGLDRYKGYVLDKIMKDCKPGQVLSPEETESLVNCRLGFEKIGEKFYLNAWADTEPDDYKKSQSHEYFSIGKMSVQDCKSKYCQSAKETDLWVNSCKDEPFPNGTKKQYYEVESFNNLNDAADFLSDIVGSSISYYYP